MADVFTKKRRSEVMSLIRSRANRTTELRLLAEFHRAGICGWRRNYRLPGRPDFVFPSLRLAVFADGCFWHGCPYHFKKPKSRRAYWEKKIARNKDRDLAVTRMLRRRGWRVVRVWEHELQKTLPARLRKAVVQEAD